MGDGDNRAGGEAPGWLALRARRVILMVAVMAGCVITGGSSWAIEGGPEKARIAAPCPKKTVEGMACIPGGWFLRGSADGPEDTRPRERVWVDTFLMDTHEVTNEAFQACRAKKKCGYNKPFYPDFDRARQPVVAVSWFRAVEFCLAAGKHLPTEAEWEKAARGTDGALHPWGNEPATCERAIIKEGKKRSCGVEMDGPWPKTGRTFEVGARPAGVYGLFDMSGNAWEWVFDWHSKSYAECGAACRGSNPRGPCDGKEPCPGHAERVVRGGSWYWDASYATAIHRRPHFPNNRPFHHFGFRCAASLDEAATIR